MLSAVVVLVEARRLSLGSLILLAFGLAMDATAVSVSLGLSVPRVRPRHAALVAVFFGGSQGLLPVLGWLLGASVGPAVAAWDHWIAFVLLTGIGANMVYEAGDMDEASGRDRFGLRTMAALALATSIVAFAAGLVLPMLGAPLAVSAITIGLVTAVASVAGLYTGRRFGTMLGRNLDRLGGFVLILLGVATLLDDLGWLSIV